MASALAHDQLGPSRRKDSARERILDLAEASVLQKGFSATSIEELIAGAGITKSGFFYHFRSKAELARALIDRYVERDETILNDLFARAAELSDDPLHAFLIGMKMFAELAENMPDSHPGCLVASYCYQEQLFSQDIRDQMKHSVMLWRRRFRAQFDRIAERYPPRVPVDFDALADMMSAVVDGGITLSMTLKRQEVLPQQILLYRQFVRSIFAPA